MKKKINNKLIRSFDSCYNPTDAANAAYAAYAANAAYNAAYNAAVNTQIDQLLTYF